MTSKSQYQDFLPEHPQGKKVEKESKLTPSDILGPFYRPGATFRKELCDNTDLVITGKVFDETGTPVQDNTYIEFWQADKDGNYDVAGQNYRGIQALGYGGTYELKTIRPGDYDISDPNDPQPHDFRCSHIHVKIWVNGRDVLTTQLYFHDDPYNKTDHWFDARRIVEFSPVDTMNNGVRSGTFDFVIKKPE